MHRRVAVTLAIAVVAALGACSGDDAADPGGADASPEAPTTTTASEGTGATTTTPEPVAPTPTAQSSTTLPPDPLLAGELAEVVVATPEHGNPTRPLLGWESVDGAAEYEVVVFHPDGRPWWAWSGTTTEVVLGGLAAPDVVELGGPTATPGTTWGVFAFDAEGRLLAVSETRALEP